MTASKLPRMLAQLSKALRQNKQLQEQNERLQLETEVLWEENKRLRPLAQEAVQLQTKLAYATAQEASLTQARDTAQHQLQQLRAEASNQFEAGFLATVSAVQLELDCDRAQKQAQRATQSHNNLVTQINTLQTNLDMAQINLAHAKLERNAAVARFEKLSARHGT